MRKIWLVVKREYLTRVRTKGFILSTVGLPLFSLGVFALSFALATRKADHPLKISILDNLGVLRRQSCWRGKKSPRLGTRISNLFAFGIAPPPKPRLARS